MGRNYNGEGTFYYSEKLKRYIGQFTDKNTGKRKTVSDINEKKAKAKFRKALVDSENGKFINRSNVTVQELAEEIISLKYNSNIHSANSHLRSIESLKKIQNHSLGNTKIQKVTRGIIQDFLTSISSLSNSYISKIFQLLQQTFNEAILREIIIKNPMISIKKPKSKKQDKKIEALSLEEHRLFINSLENEKYKHIFLIAINTGLRIGEILSLKPADIDFQNGYINVNRTITKDINDNPIIGKSTKTYAGTREIPMDVETRKVLKEAISNMRLTPNSLIFSLPNGNIIRSSTINIVFKRICKNLGFSGKNYNVHMLRHTFATRCIEAGMPAHVLQKLLGHSDVSTTINTYTTIFNAYKIDEIEKVIQYKKENLI